MNAPHSHTLLKKLYEHAPPLVPSDVLRNFEHALADIENGSHITRQEIEETMIHFGKLLWPYRKAFAEFYKSAQARHADEYMHTQLHGDMRQWYTIFKQHGGTWSELKRGELLAVGYLTPPERQELARAVVETVHLLRKTTVQEIMGPLHEAYKKCILEFKLLLEDIEGRLEHVRTLAQKEKRHPALAHELDALANDFELTLCGLHPDHHLQRLPYCEEHFHGRKEERTFHGNALPGPFLTELELPEQVNLFE